MMSFGLLSRLPSQASTTASTFEPSGSIRETRRPFCSQKITRPRPSKVWPLAAPVDARRTRREPSGATL